MLYKQSRTRSYLLAATLVLAGAAGARANTGSYDKTASTEATNLLNNLNNSAQNIQTQAEALKSKGTNWQANFDAWNQIKTQVDQMSMKADRLEKLSGSVQPWQKKLIISDTVPMVRMLAAYTQDAITYLNSHRSNFADHAYQKYQEDLTKEANKLSQKVDHVERHAELRREKNSHA